MQYSYDQYGVQNKTMLWHKTKLSAPLEVSILDTSQPPCTSAYCKPLTSPPSPLAGVPTSIKVNQGGKPKKPRWQTKDTKVTNQRNQGDKLKKSRWQTNAIQKLASQIASPSRKPPKHHWVYCSSKSIWVLGGECNQMLVGTVLAHLRCGSHPFYAWAWISVWI